jgi:hypothetical protein
MLALRLLSIFYRFHQYRIVSLYVIPSLRNHRTASAQLNIDAEDEHSIRDRSFWPPGVFMKDWLPWSVFLSEKGVQQDSSTQSCRRSREVHWNLSFGFNVRGNRQFFSMCWFSLLMRLVTVVWGIWSITDITETDVSIHFMTGECSVVRRFLKFELIIALLTWSRGFSFQNISITFQGFI